MVGEGVKVLVLFFGEVQGTGEAIQDRGARVGFLALFQPDVVIDAEAGESRQFLPACWRKPTRRSSPATQDSSGPA
jgi:hypothetical protein